MWWLGSARPPCGNLQCSPDPIVGFGVGPSRTGITKETEDRGVGREWEGQEEGKSGRRSGRDEKEQKRRGIKDGKKGDEEMWRGQEVLIVMEIPYSAP